MNVTINGDYQNREEQETLTVEKRADFIIQNKNPLEVVAEKLHPLQILQTIKDRENVYLKRE